MERQTTAGTTLSTPAGPRAPRALRPASARWLGVLTLLTVVTISYVDRVNVSVLITDGDFLRHFGLDGNRTMQGMLMTVFLLGYSVGAVLLTPFYESVLGVRRGLLVSTLMWGVVTLITPYAMSALLLVMLRAVLGASEGPVFSLKTIYIADNFAPTERGKPNSVSSMGVSLGTAIGIPIVTYLVFTFSWHISFIVLGIGSAVLGAGLVGAFITSGSVASRRKRTSTHSMVAEAARTPQLLTIIIIECATLAYLWGSASWLPAYLREDRHFSIAAMGAVAATPFVASLASGLLGGWLLDRLRPARLPLVFVIGSIGTGLSVVVAITASSSAWVAGGLVSANAFWGLQAPAIPTFVQHRARARVVGSAYGLVNGAGNLVSAFMPLGMGAVIGSRATGGFTAGFGLLAGTQVVTLIAALWLLARRRRPAYAESTSARNDPV